MGHGMVGRRPIALLTLFLLGFSPAFGQGRQAAGESADVADVGLDQAAALGTAGQCPTRFDYLVLASFADAPNLLSLSTYRFRSQTGFSSIRLTGFQRVAYTLEPVANCHPRGLASRRQPG